MSPLVTQRLERDLRSQPLRYRTRGKGRRPNSNNPLRGQPGRPTRLAARAAPSRTIAPQDALYTSLSVSLPRPSSPAPRAHGEPCALARWPGAALRSAEKGEGEGARRPGPTALGLAYRRWRRGSVTCLPRSAGGRGAEQRRGGEGPWDPRARAHPLRLGVHCGQRAHDGHRGAAPHRQGGEDARLRPGPSLQQGLREHGDARALRRHVTFDLKGKSWGRLRHRDRADNGLSTPGGGPLLLRPFRARRSGEDRRHRCGVSRRGRC